MLLLRLSFPLVGLRWVCRESFQLSVILACPGSFFTIPNESEGFQTSWNDNESLNDRVQTKIKLLIYMNQ